MDGLKNGTDKKSSTSPGGAQEKDQIKYTNGIENSVIYCIFNACLMWGPQAIMCSHTTLVMTDLQS